jgi:radical SAM protein with 4Fe4S-binding SPASM domain
MINKSKSPLLDRLINQARQKSIPLNVLFELTYNCNLNCWHCYRVTEHKRAELSLSEIKSILDQLKEAGTLFLNLTGGEIFTREDFFEIAEYARSKAFALRLLTNGTLITPQVAERIKELYPIEVDISLYGAKEETHDAVTGVAGSYQEVIQAVKELSKRQVKTYLKVTLMKENIGEYKEIIVLAKDLGVECLFYPTISARNDGSTEPLTHQVEPPDLEKFFTDIMRPEKKHLLVERKVNLNEAPCNTGRCSLAISPYGDVFPCSQLLIKLGNLRETPFHQIWHCDSKELQKIRSVKIGDLPDCASCPLLAYCSRCPGIALLEDGDLRGPSRTACMLAQVMQKVEHKLYEEVIQGEKG